ncbi:TonB-dependent receptor [Novosphingobium sp. KACC 22771]|uniref:TonB-dependent receptor n=1 Tax=Novosphingobium sp. KACC 22771 TaxID=3025670 RepID=UPI00236512D1|nr:TonB-dependent receptor plug domain-containing protein [Novosphingobium sp. KACC 22771]WDF74350.1 TonB-dependent receptor plug domain-containing protein [Novosphingobium sp. KACC 22771]
MNWTAISRSAMFFCSVSMLALPVFAHAAEAEPAAEPASPSEIIVTATRSAQRLQDVAMAVTVATSEQLANYKIFDVKDVQQLAPGLQITNNDGRSNTTSLRGITFNPDAGTAPAVQVYFNEIPTDAQTVFTAMYDVKQIEVLRGPQGLLRGLSAPAGSITIATARPSFDVIEGSAQATYTSRDGYNVQTAVSLPFSDTFAIRVAGLVDGNRLNQVVDVNRNGERSRSRTESARITLGWKPSSTFSAYLTYQYLQADNKMFRQVIGSGNTPYNVYGTVAVAPGVNIPYPYAGVNIPDTSARSGPALGIGDYGAVQEGVFRNQNTSHIVNLAADWDLGWGTLSFVGAHQFSKLDIARDLDAGNALPGYQQYSNVVTPYKVDTAELRLRSNNKEGFGWGVGAFYVKQTGTTTVHQDATQFWYQTAPTTQVNLPYAAIGVPAPGFTPFTLPNTLGIDTFVNVPVDTETLSFNGNLSYKSGPFKIEGGLRYSQLRTFQTTQLTLSGATNSGPTEIIPANLQKNNHNPITGGVTVDYAIMPTMNAYFAFGHSYRSGSTGVSTPAGISQDLLQTRPEKTDSFELGLKGSALERRINYSIAAFYQKFDGYISRFSGIYWQSPTNVPTSGFFDFNYNGNAEIKGVEVTLDAKPTKNWDLGLSGSYNRARYKNALLPCNDFAGTGTPNGNGAPTVQGAGNVSYCRSNGRLGAIPDFQMNISTEIRFPMEKVTPYVRALMNYQPSYFAEQDNFNYRDRENVNLFAGFRTNDGRWTLDVFARNLLNQKRITSASSSLASNNALLAGGVFQSGYRLVNVTNPREFGVTLLTKF